MRVGVVCMCEVKGGWECVLICVVVMGGVGLVLKRKGRCGFALLRIGWSGIAMLKISV